MFGNLRKRNLKDKGKVMNEDIPQYEKCLGLLLQKDITDLKINTQYKFIRYYDFILKSCK